MSARGAAAGADQRANASYEVDLEVGESGSRRFRALARIRTGKNAVSVAAFVGAQRARGADPHGATAFGVAEFEVPVRLRCAARRDA